MMDGILRSMLSILNITPEEAGEMARKVVTTIDSVDNRLGQIEANQKAIMKALSIDYEEGANNGEPNNIIPITGSTGN